MRAQFNDGPPGGFGTIEAVRGHLLLTNCLEDELTRPNIELAMKADRLLWLDLQGTDDEVLTRRSRSWPACSSSSASS
jgi:hypothetical protein